MFVKGTIADVVCHRAVFLLDERDARREVGQVRDKAFRVGLAVPIRRDWPRPGWRLKPILVGELTAGAVANRSHRWWCLHTMAIKCVRRLGTRNGC